MLKALVCLSWELFWPGEAGGGREPNNLILIFQRPAGPERGEPVRGEGDTTHFITSINCLRPSSEETVMFYCWEESCTLRHD